MKRTAGIRGMVNPLFILFIAGISGVARAGVNTWTTHGPQGAVVTAIAIDPATPSTLYAAAVGGLYKSVDGGLHWNSIDVGRGINVLSLAVDPANPATVYAATLRAGVYKSRDGGNSWSPANSGMTSGDVQALVIDPQSPTTIYAGTLEYGCEGFCLFKSTNGGSSWTPTGRTPDVLALAVDPTTPSTLYAGTYGSGVFKSINAGDSWSAVNVGFPDQVVVYALAIDPSAPATVYAGTAGRVFKSTDGGGTWTATGFANLASVWALAIDTRAPATLYAGTGAGVFQSGNGGDSWTVMNAGLTNRSVWDLAIDPANPNRLYAGTGDGVFEYEAAPGSCAPGITTLCLNGGFKIPRSSVVLHVDANAPSGGDGTGATPYSEVPAAVVEARSRFLASGARVKIQIEPGTYVLTHTLLLDVPGLELRGSNVMPAAEDGWPIDVLQAETETRIVSAGPFAGAPLIHVAPSGSELTGSGVTIANLTVDHNREGNAILIERAQGFTVKGCFLTRALPGGVLALLSSGTIGRNYITGTGCGVCIGGGNASSPANVRVVGNRSVSNTNGGVLLDAGVTGTDESHAALSVVIQGNDLSDNTGAPLNSFGIRVFTSPLGPFLLANDNRVTALIVGNRIRSNRIGVVLDAGFPHRAVDSNVDSRLFRGSLEVTLRDNDVAANLSAPALITFTRNSAALSPAQLSSWKYLQDSSFRITDIQNSLAGFWLDHPEFDPVDGRELDNSLTINGVEVPNGRTIPNPIP